MQEVISKFRGVAILSIWLSVPGNAQDLPALEVDGIVKSVTDFERFDLAEIEETVKIFLNTETVTERLKYVRDGERVLPLMKKYYGGEEIEPEGFNDFDKSELSYRGDMVTSMVEIDDYSSVPIAVMRIVTKVIGEDEVSYKIDWESWVGFCEMSLEEMKIQRPNTPVLVRVIASGDRYYNFDFADDEKWDSCKLLFRDSDETISGYVKVGSKASKQLADLRRTDDNMPFTLKVVYPANGRSKSQVEIVEVVEKGWIIGLSEEAKDEK
mgnify:CR=1 FL=1